MKNEFGRNTWGRKGVIGTVAANANLIGPDYFSGWGIANIEAAADLLIANQISGNRSTHICEHILYDQQVIEIPIQVDDLSTEIRAMICWSDPPFQVAAISGLGDDVLDPEVGPADVATSRLMNDLDLRIEGPDGTIYEPWAPNPPWNPDPNIPFDIDTLFESSPRGDNTRDNVEQVVVTFPSSGEYILRISHKGTLRSSELISAENEPPLFQLFDQREQAVSIVVSGNIDTDPLLPRITQMTLNESETRYYLEVEGFKGVFYQLEESADLFNWTNVNNTLSLLEIETNPTVFLSSLIAGSAKKFYRVRPISPDD